MLSSLRSAAKAQAFRLLRTAARFEAPRIVVYFEWPDFDRRARAIAHELNLAGLPTSVQAGPSRATLVRVQCSPHLHIGFWNGYPHSLLPSRYIYFNAEPLHIDSWRTDDRMSAMRNALEVWDYSLANDAIHERHEHRRRYVPFGFSKFYTALFERATSDSGDEDIDVLFVGLETPRRARLFQLLRDRGVKLHVISGKTPLWGDSLYRMIRRSRIVLSIFGHEDPETHVPDLARLDILLSNSRFVLHERPHRPDDHQAFTSAIATASMEDMPAAIDDWLSSTARRREAARFAHEWFAEHLPLARFLPFDRLQSQLAHR